MTDQATEAARTLARTIQTISPRWSQRQRCARALIGNSDPFDRFVPARLLEEAAAPGLGKLARRDEAAVLFMDRLGGGDGAHAANALILLLGETCDGASFTHVSFSTPSRGLGSLLRGSLARAGAKSGVLVDVVAHNRPAEGLRMTEEEADALVGQFDLVISYAPSGAGGLLCSSPCPLLARSHAAVLSFPDPEHLVADLKGMEAAVQKEPGMDSIRMWAMALDEDGEHRDMGHCILGEGGDAGDRLWVLLDNARRRLYHFFAQPLLDQVPSGDSLYLPCKGLLERGFVEGIRVSKVVPAGNRLLAIGSGKLVLD